MTRNQAKEIATSEQMTEKEKKLELESLASENRALKNQLESIDAKLAKRQEVENTILAEQNKFVQATFEFTDVSQRNEKMKTFIFSQEKIEELLLNQAIEDKKSISSTVKENKNYIRQVNEDNYEVLTRVNVQYNQDAKNEQDFLFKVQYRKTPEKQWKVVDMTFAEDVFSNKAK